ncbi:type II secretion system protein J [Marinimicrobium sp. ABcell2]|uniref:PulJ/GspJ family protein n=1 Tax=Marinimicrobium sp. ABcell2 TaxID=3069751 RepID=UPI0027AE94E2|nr:type II secretion system protein [Marinimicrobium sp. ABcell2]MDQ2075232.1 type II secretion system protein [Marinimicrobium sp. ABcell2]
MRGRQSAKGFTLVEVITVVVILAIVSVIGTTFIVSSTESYMQTRSRAKLVNTARPAIERMTRQLRGALPHSVRVTNGGQCVQFLPVAGAGTYLNAVPDQSNNAPNHSSIATSAHDQEFGDAAFLSIGAMGSDELYGGGGVSLAEVTGRTATSVSFASRRWERNSLSRRFYLLDQPQAFCLFNNQLRFYPDQDITASAVDTGSTYQLLARNADASGTPFALSAGSENRSINVLISLGFIEGGERVEFNQEVLIRNVP